MSESLFSGPLCARNCGDTGAQRRAFSWRLGEHLQSDADHETELKQEDETFPVQPEIKEPESRAPSVAHDRRRQSVAW